MICCSCEGGARLALPIHNTNLGDCFRLGRNYTLAVTETVRGSELLHLTLREYLAGEKNVKRNYSSPWCQARGCVSQPIPVQHEQRIAVKMKRRSSNLGEGLSPSRTLVPLIVRIHPSATDPGSRKNDSCCGRPCNRRVKVIRPDTARHPALTLTLHRRPQPRINPAAGSPVMNSLSIVRWLLTTFISMAPCGGSSGNRARTFRYEYETPARNK